MYHITRLVICILALYTVTGVYSQVFPSGVCRYQLEDGRLLVLLGYKSLSTVDVILTSGTPMNELMSDTNGTCYPSTFAPGTHSPSAALIAESVGSRVSWRVSGRETGINIGALPLCCNPLVSTTRTKSNPFPKLLKSADGCTTATLPAECKPVVTSPVVSRKQAPRARNVITTQPAVLGPIGAPSSTAAQNMSSDVTIDVDTKCSVTVQPQPDLQNYFFNISFISPSSWRYVITAGEYTDNIRQRGSCDSMVTNLTAACADLWTPQRVEHGWLSTGKSGSRVDLTNHFSVAHLNACTLYNGDRAFPLCSMDSDGSDCLGPFYATVLRPTTSDVCNSAGGEVQIAYTVPCRFDIQEHLSGTISTSFQANQAVVTVSWLSMHCIDVSDLLQFTLQTVVSGLVPPPKLVFYSVSSGTPGFGISLTSSTLNCSPQLANKCYQTWVFTTSQVPPVSAAATVLWKMSHNGVEDPDTFVQSIVHIEVDDTCDGIDTHTNYTCDADVGLYQDGGHADTYDYDADYYFDGFPAFAEVDLSTACCSDMGRNIKLKQIRLCWSNNEQQVIPYDPDLPNASGCSTSGADVVMETLYDNGVANTEYSVSAVESVSCSANFSWTVIMKADSGVRQLIEVDWSLAGMQLLTGGLRAGDEPETETHTETIQFYVDCGASSLYWDEVAQECRHTYFWSLSSWWLGIFGCIVVCIIIVMLIVGCGVKHCQNHHVDVDELEPSHHHQQFTDTAVFTVYKKEL
jgi:hypothetical protein